MKCVRPGAEVDWTIEVQPTFILRSGNGKILVHEDCPRTFRGEARFGKHDFIKWNELTRDFLMNDKVAVEIDVEILACSQLSMEQRKLKDFSSRDERSGFTLVVKNENFHVMESVFALQSSFFDSMPYGDFQDAGMKQIFLHGFCENEVQTFLEFLYHMTDITVENVEIILKLAHMLDMKGVLRVCEKFLIAESRRNINFTCKMAIEYGLDRLKRECLSILKRRGATDIRAALPWKFSSDEERVKYKPLIDLMHLFHPPMENTI